MTLDELLVRAYADHEPDPIDPAPVLAELMDRLQTEPARPRRWILTTVAAATVVIAIIGVLYGVNRWTGRASGPSHPVGTSNTPSPTKGAVPISNLPPKIRPIIVDFLRRCVALQYPKPELLEFVRTTEGAANRLLFGYHVPSTSLIPSLLIIAKGDFTPRPPILGDPNRRPKAPYFAQIVNLAEPGLITETFPGRARELSKLGRVTQVAVPATPAPTPRTSPPTSPSSSPSPEPAKAGYIAAEASNGKVGYVKNSDLNGIVPAPDSPADAVRQQAARGAYSTVMPVFGADGTTPIGLFYSGAAGGQDGSASNSPHPPGAARASTTCPDGNGVGFLLNPPSADHGDSTAVAAARDLSRHDGIAGFGSPGDTWVATPGSGGTTITTGRITLTARQQSNGTWVIDSGQRCTD